MKKLLQQHVLLLASISPDLCSLFSFSFPELHATIFASARMYLKYGSPTSDFTRGTPYLARGTKALVHLAYPQLLALADMCCRYERSGATERARQKVISGLRTARFRYIRYSTENQGKHSK